MYRVDSTWTKYQFAEGVTDGRTVSARHRAKQSVKSGRGVPVLADVTNDTIATINVTGDRSFQLEMDSGYPTLVPIRNSGTISLKTNSSINTLVGTPVQLLVETDFASSTSFDDKTKSLSIDVGDVLIGATTLAAARWFSLGAHGYRISALFAGTLASAVRGAFTVRLAWVLQHSRPPDDQWDSFTAVIHVALGGVVGSNILRVLD